MYSNRITHLRLAPKNIDYWDYSILCHGDDAVARVLQRFEYWDGTKAGGNVHGEDTNEQLQAAGQEPTQEVSRYVYKTVEELAWELLGSVSERSLPRILDTLCDQLGYLKRRNNPYSTFDHTRQYEFQEALVVAHLGRLSAIVEHFLALGRRITPVLYAIEQLTRKGIYVAHLIRQADGSFVEDESQPTLSVERVAAELRSLHAQMHADAGKKKPTLPRFVRSALAKDELRGFGADSDTPQEPPSSPNEASSASPSAPSSPPISALSHPASRSGNFAGTNTTPCAPSIRQNCRNISADFPQPHGSSAETIPFITSIITSLTTTAVAACTTSASPSPPPLPDAALDAAAAGCSEGNIFSSTPEEPACGQTPTPEREPTEQEPTPPASAPVTDLAVHRPPDRQQGSGLAQQGESESSPAAPSRPAALPPTSSPSPHSVTPALSGAQAQAGASAQDAPVSPEAMVALVERLLGIGYDAAARARQLEAARQLLAMKLLPDLSTLSRLYALCYDDWWRQHYGPMHLTHLLAREPSGQPRILRLLARLTPTPVAACTPASASSLRPATGWTAVGRQSWQPEKEADSWLKQNQRASLEQLLRNGDHLVAKMRADGDREAERFAACLQFLKQQQAQQQAQGGMACTD